MSIAVSSKTVSLEKRKMLKKKEKAAKWVLDQIQNQSRDFLQRHGIVSTEYDEEAKTFVLRNRHCVKGEEEVFTHCWPFDFTLLYGGG